MSRPLTLFEKLWVEHEVTRREDGASLLWVDRHFVHEGSHHAFAKIDERGLPVAEPDLTVAVVDHYAPTRRRNDLIDPSIRHMIETLRINAAAHALRIFDLGDPRQGIVHVIGPEQGLTLPGQLITCGDSHTATHGALGALGFGIGATEVAHVLATQTIWQKRPKTMQISVEGTLGPAVTAKDIALNWISRLGTDGAQGHAIEYAGSTIRNLSIEGRLTLCNLSIEGGAKFGLVAPDSVTFDYVKRRPFSPKGEDWENAMSEWVALASDPDADFDQSVTLSSDEIAPTVTWGTSPEQALPIDANIPDPSRLTSEKADAARAALEYMGLTEGRPIEGTPVDQVFIGSCTNARIEDLRAAAAVLSGRQASVAGMVSPGSSLVRAQAEQEGLDQVFKSAGLEWVSSGCSMCVGMNGDLVAPGKRCASTTNRNFRGRQGRGSRTHLMSPAMVAAAAVAGKITDARPFLKGRAD